MITLDRYGLHWMEGGIALLAQQGKTEHVLDIQMEFDVVVKKPRQGLFCPHNIRLEEAEYQELPDDELVRAMLPVPKTFGAPVFHVKQSPAMGSYLNDLLRLSTAKTMVPLWSTRADLMSAQFQLTNVAPIVVFGYSHALQHQLNQIIEMAYYSPRQLILMAPENAVLRPEVERLDIEAKSISGLPLERIGAWHLKQRMLGNE